jgi:hypothetical protein
MHGVVRHSVGIRGGGVHCVVLHNVDVLGLACTACAGAIVGMHAVGRSIASMHGVQDSNGINCAASKR